MWMCVTLLVGSPALCKANYCHQKGLDMPFWKTGTHLVLLESSPHSTFQLLFMAGIVLQLWYVAFHYSTLYFLLIFGAILQKKSGSGTPYLQVTLQDALHILEVPQNSFFVPTLFQILTFQIYQNFRNKCLNRNSERQPF